MKKQPKLVMDFTVFEPRGPFGKTIRRTVHKEKRGHYINYRGIRIGVEISPRRVEIRETEISVNYFRDKKS